MHHDKNTPTNVIILQKNIRLQCLFKKATAKMPAEVFGRVGRWYLSKEMKEIKDWCEKHDLQFSFDYFREKGRPFMEDNMLGVIGNIGDMSDFPIPYEKVETL